MRWKIAGLVFVILLVIGFLPISLAASCPKVSGCTNKAFPGRFCYQGEDITDTILQYYVSGGKFYLPEKVTIYGCKFTGNYHWCSNTAYRKETMSKRFSLTETGTINCTDVMTYNITVTEDQLINITKKYVYTDVSFQTKKEGLPLILEDLNSTKLEEVRNEGNQSKYEELVIYEMLNNTVRRLNKGGTNVTYSVPATSYGVLKVKKEKYYISFEKSYTHMMDIGLIKVKIEKKCSSEGTSGYTILNVLQHTITVTNKILKLFW